MKLQLDWSQYGSIQLIHRLIIVWGILNSLDMIYKFHSCLMSQYHIDVHPIITYKDIRALFLIIFVLLKENRFFKVRYDYFEFILEEMIWTKRFVVVELDIAGFFFCLNHMMCMLYGCVTASLPSLNFIVHVGY